MDSSLVAFFDAAGWTVYPTALFGVLAVISSLVSAARPERPLVALIVSLCAATLLSGALGTGIGLSGVVLSSANASAAERQELITACSIQALSSLTLACVLVMVASLGAASKALRVAVMRA